MTGLGRPSRRVGLTTLLLALTGASAVGTGLLADRIVIGGQAGFGWAQLALVAGGLIFLLAAASAIAHACVLDPPAAVSGGAPARERPGTRFRPDLEGLRAVAVILVLLFHAEVPGLAGGFVGVDVFFVLSGYLITALLLREIQGTGTIALAAFYARRLRRLLPAAAVALYVTVAASAILLPPLRVPGVAADGVAAALYASNLRFAFQATDYLQSAADPSPLLHFWSLGVEEQFYVLWPALLLAVGRRPGLERRIATLAAAVGAASFLLSLRLTDASAPWAFFSLPTRAWELAIGALLAVGEARFGALPALGASTFGWLGLGMVIASAFALDTGTPFPGTAALLPTVGAALVIAAGVRLPVAAPGRLLGSRPLRYLGRISYSLYLWHWPLIVLPAAALGSALGLPTRLGLALATIPIAAASQRWIEEPFRHGWLVGTAPRRVLAFAALATVFLATSSLAAAQLSSVREADRDTPRIYADGCHLDFPSTTSGPCAYGNPASPTTVVLFGDSHAAQWFPALERLADDRDWRLVSLTKSACPSADVTVYLQSLKRPYAECDAWRESALGRIDQIDAALVVVANSRGHLLLDGDAIVGAADYEAVWSDALARTLERLGRDDGAVTVIGDTPRSRLDVPVCLSRHADDPLACATARAEALDAAHLGAERDVALELGIPFVDPTLWVCPSDPCPVVIGTDAVYRDEHHLTAAYARHLATRLAGALPVPGP